MELGDRNKMVTFEDALGIVRAAASPLDREATSLADACLRVLFDDIASDIDMPPFDKSAMDGFACRASDMGRPLKIVGTIRAGRLSEKAISEGECMRIMTGAAIPAGADTVVKLENTVESDGVISVRNRSPNGNICYRGEDIRAGETVLVGGTLITPAVAAVLAAVGTDPVPVFRRPVLGILATGDELVEPGELPPEVKIRNSNSTQLIAQAGRAGFETRYLGIAGDSRTDIGGAIQRASGEVDVYLVSGGVSVGDYDYVPSVLEESGFEILLRKVAMKPGKPLVFGRRDDAWAFGLPGNPVSAFVLFEIFIKDFCFRLMGYDYKPDLRICRLGGTFTRKNARRLAHLPVAVTNDGLVHIMEYHGSAHINAYCKADGIMRVPAGIEKLEEGEPVWVVMISKP